MSISAVRIGLATALEAIPEAQVYPYVVMPTPPTIWVARFDVGPPPVMGSRVTGHKYSEDFTAYVQAMTDFVEPQRGQELLDQFMAGSGVYSVAAAIEADSSLGGVADYAVVDGVTGPTLNTFQTFSLLLAEWTVRIRTSEVAL